MDASYWLERGPGDEATSESGARPTANEQDERSRSDGTNMDADRVPTPEFSSSLSPLTKDNSQNQEAETGKKESTSDQEMIPVTHLAHSYEIVYSSKSAEEVAKMQINLEPSDNVPENTDKEPLPSDGDCKRDDSCIMQNNETALSCDICSRQFETFSHFLSHRNQHDECTDSTINTTEVEVRKDHENEPKEIWRSNDAKCPESRITVSDCESEGKSSTCPDEEELKMIWEEMHGEKNSELGKIDTSETMTGTQKSESIGNQRIQEEDSSKNVEAPELESIENPNSPRWGDRKKKLYCRVCSMKFKNSYVLRQHLETIHAETFNSESEDESRRSRSRSRSKSRSRSRSSELNRCPSERGGDSVIRFEVLAPGSVDSENEDENETEIENSDHLDSRKHECNICGNKFTCQNSLQTHLQLHLGKKFECDLCELKFTTDQDLTKHSRIVHEGEKLFACDQCDEKCGSISTLKTHINQSHSIQICTICSAQVPGSENLKVHEKGHSSPDPSRPYNCGACLKCFRTPIALKTHLKIHDPNHVYTCQVCLETFNRKQSLDEHERSHSGQKPWVCEACGKTMNRRTSLRDHMAKLHPELPPLPDLPRTKISPNAKHMYFQVGHKTIHESGDMDAENTDQNGETSGVKTEVDSNKDLDSTVGADPSFDHCQSNADYLLPFPCDNCPFSFQTIGELGMHMRMNHTGDSKFSCKECSQNFPDVVHLRHHLDRIHTIQICDLCSQQINGSDNLEIHRKTHFDEDQIMEESLEFKCQSCPESFGTEAKLDEHALRVHEAFWTCDLCHEQVSQSISLPEHISESHTRRRGRGRPTKKTVAAGGRKNKSSAAKGNLSAEEVKSDSLGKSEMKTGLRRSARNHGNSEPDSKKRKIKAEASSQQKHECNICGRGFSRHGSLERHLQIHIGKKFTCDKCSQKFAAMYDLTVHKRTVHQGEKPHSCEQCNESFNSLPNLRNHVTQFHQEFSCNECSEVFVGKKALKVHENKHVPFDPAKPFKCGECFKYFKTQWELTLHIRIHDPEYSFACEICGKKFNRKQSYDEHIRLHEGKMFVCEVCDKKFTRKATLRDHRTRLHPDMSSQTSRSRDGIKEENLNESSVLDKRAEDLGNQERDRSCSVCEKKFTSKEALHSHELSHIYRGPFKCAECEKEFDSREKLKKHLLHHKRRGVGEAECLQCGTTYRSAQALRRHLATHTRTKPHQCDKCAKSFTLPFELRKHKRSVHLGMKDYSCSVCKRRFSSSQGMRCHEKFAHGKGPPLKLHKCTICSKEFPVKIRLEAHLRMHSGERPFQCQVCNQLFRMKINLDRHAFIHDPSKRFNCKRCDKFFSRKGHLLVHEAKAHQIMIYRCPYCKNERYFETLDQLTTHKKDYHPEDFKTEEPGYYLPWEQKPKNYQFQCDRCPKSFCSRTNLRHHSSVHTNDRPFACEFCDHRSISKSALKTHYQVHNGIKEHSCSFCGKAFGREWVLKRHILTRHTEMDRPHKCEQCDKTFRLPVELKQHIQKMHTRRERAHECRICQKRFFEPQQLTEHLQTHDSDGEFRCEFCCVPFPKAALLEMHTKTHLSMGPYECFLCKQNFDSKTPLESHLSQHEQDGIVHCPFCGKLFRQVTNLLNHMIIHSGMRNDKLRFYECDPCERTFWRHDAYHEHCRTEHGEQAENQNQDINFLFENLVKEIREPVTPLKPEVLTNAPNVNELMCGFCGREFARKYTLDRHIKCHTNDRPYHCEICEARFIAKYDLTLHMRRHNNEKPFVCTVCGKGYEVAYRLATHMKTSKDGEHQKAYLMYSNKPTIPPRLAPSV